MANRERRLLPLTSDPPDDFDRQIASWQPFTSGHSDPTWREFMREQEKIEREIDKLSGEMSQQKPHVTSDVSSGPEVLTWPSPVIKTHKNGATSFCLDVNVGDTYRPDEIHVNIVDGHVLHIHAQHKDSKRQVRDNTLSASKQHSEFDRRFALPDHEVKPENLNCLVTPEGVLHIRGFLGNKIVAPQKTKPKKAKPKVNFAVFKKS